MTDIEKERNELNHLINEGVEFKVSYTLNHRKFSLRKLRTITVSEEVHRTYKIQEPTLAVLDLLSKEITQAEYDALSDEEKNNDPNKKDRTKVAKHNKRSAKIVAIAVLGEDCFENIKGRYVVNEKKINELAEVFSHCIKPSELIQVCNIITATSNLADFMNSIRLMSVARTTMPIRIE